MWIRIRGAFSILLSIAAGTRGDAQQLTAVRNLGSIQVVHETNLPDSGGASAYYIFMDSKHRFYEPRTLQPSIIVFDSAGRAIGSFGRRGRGPGELSMELVAGTAGPGDTIHVFEFLWPWKHSVYAPDSYAFIRSGPIPKGPSWSQRTVILPNGDYFWFLRDMAHVANPPAWTHSIGILRDSGTQPIRSAFGAEADEMVGPLHERRILKDRSGMCLSPRGTVWTTNRTLYRLQEWTTKGKLLRTLTHLTSWFPSSFDDRNGTTTMRNCQVDREGRMWILLEHPIPEAIARTRPRTEGGPPPIELPEDSLYYSRIEVIDIPSRKVITSQTFRRYFVDFLPGLRVIEQHEDADGNTSFEISHLELGVTPSK